jgi:hypothetical protein
MKFLINHPIHLSVNIQFAKAKFIDLKFEIVQNIEVEFDTCDSPSVLLLP